VFGQANKREALGVSICKPILASLNNLFVRLKQDIVIFLGHVKAEKVYKSAQF
jgi:hypothetical protein